jgi:inorganic pyrophosphatase
MRMLGSIRQFMNGQKMELYNIPHHVDTPKIVHGVVEIPKGKSTKYEYDPVFDQFTLDRCLPSSMCYPCSYGFIPKTMTDDGDALDILIYNDAPISRGTIVTCRTIGVLDMTDSGAKDWKIIGTPIHHQRDYRSLADLDQMVLRVLQNFFLTYKSLENKIVCVEDWHEKEFAYEIIKESMKE